jgi:hypothetical protein
MKRLAVLVVLAVLSVIALVGCANPSPARQEYVWESQPARQHASNEHFDVELEPIFKKSISGFGPMGCQSFNLKLVNKTDKNIEINWNKTLYINKGQTSGDFMFEGIVYKDRNNPKLPDIIFPKVEFNKVIYPNNLISFYRSWYHNNMQQGENGVYLSVVIDGKEINEKLTVNLSAK